jgi:hypothetical protein
VPVLNKSSKFKYRKLSKIQREHKNNLFCSDFHLYNSNGSVLNKTSAYISFQNIPLEDEFL